MEYKTFVEELLLLINNSRNNVCLEDPKIYVRAVRRVFERKGLDAEQVSKFLDNMVSDGLIKIKFGDEYICLSPEGEELLRHYVTFDEFHKIL